MSFGLYPQSSSFSKYQQSGSKKDGLWHNIQPGDPYDIRKSKIGKLPGQRKIFMGEKLELICLFQAAEISRLGDNLEQYQTRYKQVDKKQLDRHSFEIQIKQLAQKLQQTSNIKSENQKLKDFIKKQTKQLQEWRAKAADMDAALQSKYHKALKQLQAMHRDNSFMKQQSNQFKKQIQDSTNKYKMVETRLNQELEQIRSNSEQEIRKLRQNLNNREHKISDIQNKVVLATQQIQRLNRVLRDKNNQLTRFQSLNDQNDVKLQRSQNEIREIKRLFSSQSHQKQELAQQNQLTRKKIAQLTSKIGEYEYKIEMYAQQKDRINSVLEGKNRVIREHQSKQAESENLARQFIQMRDQFRKLTCENKELQNQFREGQQKLRLSNAQQQRLVADLSGYKQQIQNSDQQNEQIRRKMEGINRENQTINDQMRRGQDNLRLSANQISKLNQQLQEYRGQLQQNSQQTQTYRKKMQKLTSQNSNLNDQMMNAQENLRLSANQITKLNNQFKIVCAQNQDFDKKLKGFGEIQRKIIQYENNLAMLSQEIQRLNEVIEKKNQQIGQLREEIMQLEGLTNLTKTLQQKIGRLTNENNGLSEEVHTVQQNLRLSVNQNQKIVQQLNQYKNHLVQNDQESQLIKKKMQKLLQQNSGLMQEVRNSQQNLRLSNAEQSKAFQELQQYKNRLGDIDNQNLGIKKKMKNLTDQNKQLGEQVKGAQQNLRLSANQISKLNSQLGEYKNLAQDRNMQSETYKQRINKLTGENSQISQQIIKAQDNLRLSANTVAKLNNQLKIICLQNEDIKQKLQYIPQLQKASHEYENRVAILSQQIERLNLVIEKKNNDLGKSNKKIEQIEQLNQTIGVMQDKISKVAHQNTSLGDDIRNVQQNLRLSANQNQKIVRQLNEYKSKIEENNSENNALKQKIQKLTGENAFLGDEVQTAQQNLRLSANAQVKLAKQLSEYRSRIEGNDHESETYRLKIQKLLKETSQLGQQVRESQENLRLSASTISKLNNQLKIMCNQNQALQQKIQELGGHNKKSMSEFQFKIEKFSEEIQRLNETIEKKNIELKNQASKTQEYEHIFNEKIGETQTYKRKIQNLANQNSSIGQEMSTVRQNLRLSANTLNKLNVELKVVCSENQGLQQKVKQFTQIQRKLEDNQQKSHMQNQQVELIKKRLQKKTNELEQLHKKLKQIDVMNGSIGNLQQKIGRLVNENTSLGDDMNIAQENLRLSANQNKKLMREMSDYKLKIQENNQENSLLQQKIQKLSGENNFLGEEVRSAQQNLRLSANTQAKLSKQLNQYRSRIDNNDQESEVYRQKLQKLLKENTELGNQVHQAQQNLRLSANTVSKLNSQLKSVCFENQSLQHKVDELTKQNYQLNQNVRRLIGQNQNLAQQIASSQSINESQYQITITKLSEELGLVTTKLDKKTKQANNLQRTIVEIDQSNKSIGSLQDKISRLVNQNTSLDGEMRQAHESLRLSANQNQKMMREINQYKMRIQENSAENDNLKQKINKISGQNVNLNQQVQIAQDNLRLSANNMNKMKVDIKNLNNQNQLLKKQLSISTLGTNKRSEQLEEKVILLSAEIRRLRSGELEHEGAKNKLFQYENKLGRVTEEFDKLSKIIQELRRQNSTLKKANYDLQTHIQNLEGNMTEQKMNILTGEIDRLNILVEEKEDDLSELKLRFSDEAALVKRIQQHLALFVVLFAEIESLRKRVKDKEREVEDVRRSSLAPYRNN